jgi:hypothetical protein
MSLRRLLAVLPDGDGWSTHYRPRGQPLPATSGAFDGDALAPLADAAARSPTGFALFAGPARCLVALPAFPVESAADLAGVDPAPLVALIERPRTVGAFLLRRGGAVCGVLRGGDVIAAKTAQRFVKNRHRKGGQSSGRYVRTREKQLHELFEKACATLAETLGPHERALDCVFLGGDRLTLQAFRGQCPYLDRFGERLMARMLQVPGDPRRASLDAVPRELTVLDVYDLASGTFSAGARIAPARES